MIKIDSEENVATGDGCCGPQIFPSPHSSHLLVNNIYFTILKPSKFVEERIGTMPVPLSATHANDQAFGLVAAQNAELPTAGPFARLMKSSAETNDGNGMETNVASGLRSVVNGGSSPQDKCDNDRASSAALETRGLNFWYCDIG